MLGRRLGLTVVALGACLAPFLGCTFVVQFDDFDGGATSPVTLDAGHKPIADAGQGGQAGQDAAPFVFPLDAEVLQSQAHNKISSAPSGCNPCSSAIDVGYMCGTGPECAESGDVFYCNGTSIDGTKSYSCPAAHVCTGLGKAFSSFCNPCEVGRSYYVCDAAFNVNAPSPYGLVCENGAVTKAVHCPTGCPSDCQAD